MTKEELWTEEDRRILLELDREGKVDEFRDYVGRKVFEENPRSFMYFRDYEDDPMPYAEMQKLPIEEALVLVQEWSNRSLILTWDELSRDQKDDLLWRLSLAVRYNENREGVDTDEET